MENNKPNNSNTKLAIFLHGFGFDGNENIPFQHKLLEEFPFWELITINAPFPSNRERGGYAWFDIQKETKEVILDDGKLDQSISFLQRKIQEELDKRSLHWKDLILIGRSQGAFLSILLASAYATPCYAVVCTGSIFRKCKQFELNSTPPIFWFEMEYEKFSKDFTGGYKYLLSEGCNLQHHIGKNSDHDVISDETTHHIVTVLKR